MYFHSFKYDLNNLCIISLMLLQYILSSKILIETKSNYFYVKKNQKHIVCFFQLSYTFWLVLYNTLCVDKLLWKLNDYHKKKKNVILKEIWGIIRKNVFIIIKIIENDWNLTSIY